MKILPIFCCVALGSLWVGALPAQSINGSVNGTIVDATGHQIAGAGVKLISSSTGATRAVKSAADGNFNLNAIQPGMYSLIVEFAGFKNYERRDIELTPGENLALGELKMEIGNVSDSVTVTSEIAAVQTASGERSGIITSEEVENLTVMNRDFTGLVALMPGVVDNPAAADVQGFAGGATNTFNVAGNRSNGNSVTIDGGATENSNTNNQNNFVSMDSIQAVRIVTSNYQAEFGRKPGAGIMAVTKGGTQRFHGSTYWYYRHEWMNARDFFNNRNGVAATPRRVQTPGFNIGGPVYIPGKFNPNRNKLFFFSSFEFIREKRPQPIRQLTVPTEIERAGNFTQSFDTNGKLKIVNDPLNGKTPFPGNIVPAGRFDPNGRNYLNLLPLPTAVNRVIARYNYNFQAQESLDIPRVLHTTRIDYIVNSKTTLWVKYNFWREDQQGWAVNAGNANWGWLPAHYLTQTHAPVFSLTRIISPTTILEVSARMSRFTENGSALNDSDYTRLSRTTAGVNVPQLWPGNNPHNLVPEATFGGVNTPANPSYNDRFPLRGAETPFFSDAILTNTRGSHVMKFGFYAERWKAIKGESGTWAGTLDFSTDANNPNESNHPYANALLGNFKTYTESNSRPPLYEQTTSLEWFAQDNWKISRKLTLDMGVRFGWSQPFYSPRRQEAGFVPGTWDSAKTVQLMTPVRINNVRKAQHPLTGEIYPLTVIGAIAPGTGDPYNGTVNLMTNLDYPHGLRKNSGIKAAPRFGFAYDPFGNGKTAIRGGFGVFYEIHEKDLWAYALHLDPPNQLTPQIFYGNLSSFSNTQGFLFPSNTSGLSSDRTLARTMNYSFGVQRAVAWGVMADVAYVGTLARHLLERKNLNSIAAGTTYLPTSADPSNTTGILATQYLRPYLGYGNIQYYNYDSNSSYHSLQAVVNRRFMKGVQGAIAYTWSKAMDYGDNDTANLSNLISPKIWNYGKAGFDRTHILKANWIWELPKGSNLAGASVLSKAILDGWQMSGILTIMSGAPTGVTLQLVSGSATNWSGSPTDGARPMMIANPILPKDQRTFERNLNTEAFALPARATLGNAPKDVFRGPGRNNWDISLFKNFRLTERFRAQFRGESYNTFNHTQFASVDTNAKFDNNTGAAANPQFGQFLTANFARRMQLALRITF